MELFDYIFPTLNGKNKNLKIHKIKITCMFFCIFFTPLIKYLLNFSISFYNKNYASKYYTWNEYFAK
jgi:hypothetical protein